MSYTLNGTCHACGRGFSTRIELGQPWPFLCEDCKAEQPEENDE